MHQTMSRRDVLRCAPALGVAALGLPAAGAVRLDPEPGAPATPWPGFPQQDPALVRDLVGAAHGREARVRELVDAHPALVNARWDWGFGDWESPLGAAAHTGQTSIARFLLERGAHADLFAAAMLGWLDAVKALIAADPGSQRRLGPHGITLLAHARAGGAGAAAVTEHLLALGDADPPPPIRPTDEGRVAALAGRYAFGPGPDDRFFVRLEKSQVQFVYRDYAPRRLHHLGDDAFYPAGVPSVRFAFEVVAGRAVSVTIHDHGPALTARRDEP